MSEIQIVDPGCRSVLPKLDSYLDGELITETNLDLLQHCAQCSACRYEIAQRRALRDDLRRAVRSLQAPASLAGRVRAGLRTPPGRPRPGGYLMSFAAALALCAASATPLKSPLPFRNNHTPASTYTDARSARK